MNLRSLEAFCAVYEEGSFTAGARRLGLAQPTVSSHVRSLEEEIGTALFDRLPRASRPTEAARLLHGHARRLLDLALEMQEDLDRYLHGLHGRLTVGASTIPGEYWLPTRLGPFHERWPEVDVRIEIHDTRAVVGQVRAGELELGVVGAASPEESLRFREVGGDRLVVVAPAAADWLGDGPPRDAIGLDELASLPFVLREPGSGTRASFEAALGRVGVEPGDLRVAAELGSTTAVKEAVKAGLGLTVLSRLAVRAELEAGILSEVSVEGLEPVERAFFAVVDAERPLSPPGRTFLDFLLAEAGSEG